MSQLTRGSARPRSTGVSGKETTLIRYKVITQLDLDASFLSEILPNLIDNAETVEVFLSGFQKSYFVIKVPKESEEKFEDLLGYSDNIFSYHLLKGA